MSTHLKVKVSYVLVTKEFAQLVKTKCLDYFYIKSVPADGVSHASQSWLPYRPQGLKTGHIGSPEVCRAKLIPRAAAAACAPREGQCMRVGCWLRVPAPCHQPCARCHPAARAPATQRATAGAACQAVAGHEQRAGGEMGGSLDCRRVLHTTWEAEP